MTLGDLLEWLIDVIADSLLPVLLLSLLLLSPASNAEGEGAEKEKVRTAESCATVAELNALRKDTLAVSRAMRDALEAVTKELDRHEKFLDAIGKSITKETR